MISNVSFGSKYMARTTNNANIRQQRGYSKLAKYCQENNIPYSQRESCTLTPDFSALTTLTLSMNVPDKHDKVFEAYCANQGVTIEKIISKK